MAGPFGIDLGPDNIVFFGRRPIEAGPRIFNQDVDTWYVSAGVDGQFTAGDRDMFWDVTAIWSENNATQTKLNQFNARSINIAMGPTDVCAATQGCVPLNIVGEGSMTQEMLDFVTYRGVDTSSQELFDFTANLAGEIMDSMSVIALLLVHHGQVLSTDRILEELGAQGYRATPRLLGGGLVAAGASSAGASLRGIDIEKDARVSDVYMHVAKGDWLITQGLPYIARPSYGIRSPTHRVAGLEFAGVVDAVGSDVTRFVPGDEVVGWGNEALAERGSILAGSEGHDLVVPHRSAGEHVDGRATDGAGRAEQGHARAAPACPRWSRHQAPTRRRKA